MLRTLIKPQTNVQDCLEANQTVRALSLMFFLDPPEVGHTCGAKWGLNPSPNILPKEEHPADYLSLSSIRHIASSGYEDWDLL